ncbi:MAG: hypothetical protein SNG27_10375 [Rikenellaceae bacterium]
MKKIIFALMGLAMLSCTTETIGGDYDPDTIKTSADAVTLTNENLTAEITTEGKRWLFLELEVDGKTYPLPEGEALPDEIDVELPSGYLIKASTIEGLMNGWEFVTEISCDWVTITRTLQSITFTATATEIDKPLTLKLRIQDRDYSEPITVTKL